jgi:hypothetical protein
MQRGIEGEELSRKGAPAIGTGGWHEHHQIREVVIWADQGSSLVSYRCLGYHLMSGDRSDGQYHIYV